MGVPSSVKVLSKEEVQRNWDDDLENVTGGRPRVYMYNVMMTGFLLHTGIIYGTYLLLTGALKFQTVFSNAVMLIYGFIGTTAGSHRLWAHKSYKAKLPLEIFLAIGQTISAQLSIYHWVRDHRMHHKYTETNADPHNAKRGFFFSHIGWLLVPKHEDIIKKGAYLDFSDLEKNRLVMWQHKYYWGAWAFLVAVLPHLFIQHVIGEDFFVALVVNWLRVGLSLHITFLVNSAAHLYGYRPYDKSINPCDNKWVAFFTMGEGWHNYHHVFPWDYKTSEWGHYFTNTTTAFIDFCAWLGLAYDLKTVSKDIVQQRVNRTGDGSHPHYSHSQSFDNSEAHSNELPSWGWGDKETPAELIQQTQIFRSSKKFL